MDALELECPVLAHLETSGLVDAGMEYALKGGNSDIGAGLHLASTPDAIIFAFSAPVVAARVFIDPVGDLYSFYEIELNASDELHTRIWRANRSGYRVDARADAASRITSEIVAGRFMAARVPFAEIPPATGAPGEVWRVEVEATAPGAAAEARHALRPDTFRSLRFVTK